jgi:membrane protease YdiL (CAAX protease family)
MQLRQFATERPVVASLGSVIAVFVVMGAVIAVAAGLLQARPGDMGPQILGQVVGTVVLLVVLWRLAWLSTAGVTNLGNRRLWLVTAGILVFTCWCAAMSFFGTIAVDLSVDRVMAPVLVHTAMAGVMEELLFRGLVLSVLVAAWGGTRRGVVGAVVVSALLFGASHLLNLASSSIGITFLQASEAALSAVLYGALVLAGGSLWPAVALHGMVNVFVNVVAENSAGFAVGVDDYLVFLLLQLPALLYGVRLLATVPVPQRVGGRSGVRERHPGVPFATRPGSP